MGLKEKIEILIKPSIEHCDPIMRILLIAMAKTVAQYILTNPEQFGLKKGSGEIL